MKFYCREERCILPESSQDNSQQDPDREDQYEDLHDLQHVLTLVSHRSVYWGTDFSWRDSMVHIEMMDLKVNRDTPSVDW